MSISRRRKWWRRAATYLALVGEGHMEEASKEGNKWRRRPMAFMRAVREVQAALRPKQKEQR